MRSLTLETIVQTGETVSQDHFGGNLIGTLHAPSGIPDSEYAEAIGELGVTSIRYPAGEPDERYVDGMVIEGALPAHLINYMNWAQENGHEVVVVIPTFAGYPGEDELREFTRLLLADYGDNILAFEIGNEYWQEQGETAYGEIANEATIAIGDALQEANTNIDIWVQMGYAGGIASDFRNIDEGWITRTIMANEAILDALSPEAQLLIDGAVEHYYFRQSNQYLGDLSDADNMIGLDYSIWQSHFNHELSLNITEWNINNGNLYNLGMRAASTLIAQFQFMIELGVDTAYVWPPRHNTTNDLAGSNVTIVDPETDIVVNTVGGAIFDMMSSRLVGMEALATGFSGENSSVQSYVYSDDSTFVVYVTSRSENIEDVSFSLGNFGHGASLSSATLVGYDPATADGRHWNPMEQGWTAPNSTIINGEVYYFNEHDAQAQITQLDVLNGNPFGVFNFTLNPYEVIELVYQIPTAGAITGSNRSDRIIEDHGSQVIHGLDGDDTIRTGRGEDTIFGGDGNDHIVAGAHSDFVDGGRGNDFLSGWGGDDTIYGSGGNDSLFGFQGNDVLRGDIGHDSIVGGDGDDLLVDGAGEDTLEGGDGIDTFRFDHDNSVDVISDFELGIDVIDLSNFEFLSGLAGVQIISRSWGATLEFGAETFEIRTRDGNALNSSNLTVENFIFFGNPSDTPISPPVLEDVPGEMPPEPQTIAPTIFLDAAPTPPSRVNMPLSYMDTSPGGIRGTATSEVINGDDHDNRIFGGWGRDTIHGGDGADQISAAQGNDLVNGGRGGDLLFGGNGFDTVNGGNGSDTIDGGGGADSLTGGHGNDVLLGWFGFDQIFGGTGSDSIWAGASADRVYGGEGNDWISAGSNFGFSVDGVFGEGGSDTIFGDAGFDHLDGGEGDDVIDGGNQADNLYGGGGNDLLIGGAGLDRVFGGTGADDIVGGLDNDGLFGENGDDHIWGGHGNDRVFGGQGNDLIHGGSGTDTVYAGAGFDTIEGGEGDDLLFGGFNGDRFIFRGGHGHDRIADFDASNYQERIDFSNVDLFQNWTQVIAAANQVRWNVVIDTGSDSSIELINVNISDLGVDNFLF